MCKTIYLKKDPEQNLRHVTFCSKKKVYLGFENITVHLTQKDFLNLLQIGMTDYLDLHAESLKMADAVH
jgi:hypothetical protein